MGFTKVVNVYDISASLLHEADTPYYNWNIVLKLCLI